MGLFSGYARTSSGSGAIETICDQIGWSIDERVGSDGIILYFKDPIVKIRKLMVTMGNEGNLGMMSVFSAAEMPSKQVSTEILGYLLSRNNAMPFPAWQITAKNGMVSFTLACGILAKGLDANIFKLLCETMVKEVNDFDSKMQQAGVL